MLEKLTIRNFQKHKKLEIDFDGQITTICGRSDAGKSAIIRALKWVCTNKPSGDAFIRHGQEGVLVSLQVDGHTVSRQRGKGVNSYSLDGQEYHALGQGGIPEEISNLLNINPSLNFQNQMDAPFWFMLSPGEVSKQINQIINLELIDKTLASIASQLRKAKASVSVCEERLEETKKRVSELAWSKEADKELQGLEALYKDIQDRNAYVALGRDISSEVSRLRSEKDRLSGVSTEGKEVVRLAEELLRKQENLEELKGLVDGIKKHQDSLTRYKEELRELEARLSEEMDGKCPLCKQEWEGE